MASVIFAGAGRICFSILVHRLSRPTAAHIHLGEAGTNGDIEIGLTAPAQGSPGTSSGCVPEIDGSLLNNILRNPSNYYVNVHTGQFPAGAIRGQLF